MNVCTINSHFFASHPSYFPEQMQRKNVCQMGYMLSARKQFQVAPLGDIFLQFTAVTHMFTPKHVSYVQFIKNSAVH